MNSTELLNLFLSDMKSTKVLDDDKPVRKRCNHSRRNAIRIAVKQAIIHRNKRIDELINIAAHHHLVMTGEDTRYQKLQNYLDTF